MREQAKKIALGGVLGALSVVLMVLGGLVPVATYVCPMGCMLMECVILGLCGRRIGWAWYAAVAFLSVLLSPDKEAAALVLCLGYYPMIRPWMEQRKLPALWKGIFFNAVILAMYRILIGLFGMTELGAEFSEVGTVLTIVILILGNICFFLIDYQLRLMERRGVVKAQKKRFR